MKCSWKPIPVACQTSEHIEMTQPTSMVTWPFPGGPERQQQTGSESSVSTISTEGTEKMITARAAVARGVSGLLLMLLARLWVRPRGGGRPMRKPRRKPSRGALTAPTMANKVKTTTSTAA